MDIKTIVQNIIDLVVWPVFVGGIVVMFLYSGFLFLSSEGDPTKLSKAKMSVLWAVVGIIVGILAFSAKSIITTVLTT